VNGESSIAVLFIDIAYYRFAVAEYPLPLLDAFKSKINGKANSIEQARRPASCIYYINELSGEKPG